MIFYLAADADGKTWIKPTKEQIKDINDKVYKQIDIPTEKAGLQAWIQQMLNETINTIPQTATDTSEIHEATEEFLEKAELKLPETKILPPSPQVICEWLQDTATQREIELVFGSIGCRIGELFRENRS